MLISTILQQQNIDSRVEELNTRKEEAELEEFAESRRPEAESIGEKIETGTVFLNRCDYVDPSLCWTGCKDTGRGGGLSMIGYHNLTRPKSFHLKRITA